MSVLGRICKLGEFEAKNERGNDDDQSGEFNDDQM